MKSQYRWQINNRRHLKYNPDLYASPFDLQDLRGQLRHNEPMSKHTTWRVGGPAEWFYQPADVLDLSAFLQRIPPDIPLFWLGLGSNILVRDGGIKGVVIATSGLLNTLTPLDEHRLYVEAGVSCAKVARTAAQQGLTGTEFLAGIPGTMGGALAMNASAWGGETWVLVRGVETMDRYGNQHRRTVTDYQVGYRTVKGPSGEWFTAVTLQLLPGSNEDSQIRIRELLKKRNDSQPIGQPSCGSVFRNPPGDYAARLIEQAGWKGRCLRGACVSEKHANFIINQGEATAQAIEELIGQIRNSIQESTGVTLIPEVHVIGETV